MVEISNLIMWQILGELRSVWFKVLTYHLTVNKIIKVNKNPFHSIWVSCFIFFPSNCRKSWRRKILSKKLYNGSRNSQTRFLIRLEVNFHSSLSSFSHTSPEFLLPQDSRGSRQPRIWWQSQGWGREWYVNTDSRVLKHKTGIVW